MGNDVKIIQEDLRTTRVIIDGVEVQGVRSIEYSNAIDETPVIILEFMPETLNVDKEKTNELIAEIKIDTDEVVERVINSINKQSRIIGKKGVVI